MPLYYDESRALRFFEEHPSTSSPDPASDPQLRNGCANNDRRGAGSKFGPDVAADF